MFQWTTLHIITSMEVEVAGSSGNHLMTTIRRWCIGRWSAKEGKTWLSYMALSDPFSLLSSSR
jgi:hypothetical protein